MPGVISSLILFIVGAIARFAYSDSVWSWTSGGHSHSVRVDTVGMILMFAGAVALLLSIAWSFYKPSESFEKEETVAVQEDPYEPPVKAKKNTRSRKS